MRAEALCARVEGRWQWSGKVDALCPLRVLAVFIRHAGEVEPVSVLVLNAGYEPLHQVSVQHAVRMLARNVAVVEEAVQDRRIGPYPFPRVLRLVRYVAMRWRHRAPRWSRNRLLDRDSRVCCYCGAPATTVDHVVPLSRGGRNDWLNTVAACRPCNNRKGDRSPSAAGLALRSQPFVPSWWQLLPAR